MAAPWKTVRVFISSTFRDMQAERDWLVRFVFPRLREELVKCRIHFVDVDLRWGVTSEDNVTEVCREVVKECRPRFLCILGGRYGHVPQDAEKSITADEIDYGVFNPPPGDAGPMRAFFYFRKDEATAAIPEDDARSGRYREYALQMEIASFGPAEAERRAGDRALKLRRLKDEIIRRGLPLHHYDAEWDAAQKRLIGLEEFGERVHADLLQSLKDDPELAPRFTGERTGPPDEFDEEADQMDAFIEERTAQYITGSREPLLREMLAFAAGDGAPNIFVLTGDPGSGKSALLAKFARELAALHPSSFILPTFVGASTGSTDLRRTLRRLCHELTKAAENTEPLPLDLKELITHFQKLLAEAAGRRRVILVFDALNQFDATDGAHWLNWLPQGEKLPPGVRIVASVIAPADGQPGHQTLAILRTRPGTRMEKLEPLTEADTLAVIEGCLRRYAKRLSPEQLAALLAKPAGRLPLYVLTALEELRTLGTYEEITDRIRTLPGDARALFGWILTERLARDPGFRDREGRPCGAALVEKFAACLGVSRHGLSPAELTALLDPGDPLGNVAALLRLLRPYLMRRGELLDFYHGQFREAAGAAWLDTAEKQRTAHQSVATCLQAFADPHRDGQCRDATRHALSELPHHQTRAEAWPDLIATLENIFFLEAKVTHDMAFDLAEDFTAAVDALPPEHVERQSLRLLDEALRRDIHFIARHAHDYPQALFQCLWNSCWWFDCPEAAPHYATTDGHWNHPDEKLQRLVDCWRSGKERAQTNFPWLRSLRPPPMHLGTSQRLIFRGHENRINSVSYSPDGRCIASGSWDSTVRLWDAQSGEELAVLRGHQGRVTSVAFSPDGRRVVSGSHDKTLRLWDAHSGLEVTILRGHEDPVNSVCFSPDGQLIASGSGWSSSRHLKDDTVRLWDAQRGMEVAVLRGHTWTVNSVCFSPDGHGIASGSDDLTVRLWDAQSGSELAILTEQTEHIGKVSSVCFSPDGRQIALGSDDNTVVVLDSQVGEELTVLSGFESVVSSVCFSPDGRHIAGGLGNGTVRVWDAHSGADVAVFQGHENSVNSVCFSPGGLHIASGSGHVAGSSDHTVRVWAIDGGLPLALLRGHDGDVSCASFSPDGRRIVSGSLDGTLRVWNADTGAELTVLRGHIDSPGPEHGKWTLNDVFGRGNRVECASFSPDGHRIVSGSRDRTARVWDASSGAELSVLRGHKSMVKTVCFSPNGEHVVTGSMDESIRVWDAGSGEQLLLLHTPNRKWERGEFAQGGVWRVCWSTDGRNLLSANYYEGVRIWDIPHGTPVFVFRPDGDFIKSVCYSPDGRRFATVSEKGEGRVWDAHTFECIETIANVTDARAIAAGPRAVPLRLLTHALDTVVVDANTGSNIARLPIPVDHSDTHPSGSRWVGASTKHLVLFQIEGWKVTP